MNLAVISVGGLLLAACGARTELDENEAPAVPPEVCDGADQDGDGVVDEGLPLAIDAEPIRVRTDEGTTGDCARCTWIETALVPVRDGMMVVGRIYDEGEPDPNLLLRRLDARGHPLEPWDLLPDVLSTEQPFPSIYWERGVGAIALGTAASGRGGPPRPELTILDADGARVAGPVRVPRGVGRWGTPQITRLADGTFLTAHDCTYDVCLAAFSADGTPRESWSLAERSTLLPRTGLHGIAAPVLAHRDGLVGVATIQVHAGPPERAELLFFLLAADGTLVREARSDLPLPEFEYVPITTMRMVASDDGFLVMFLRRDNCYVDERLGRWVARFDRAGRLVSGPTVHEPAWCLYGGDFHLQPRRRGGWWMSGTRSLDPEAGIDGQEQFVAELDESGVLRWANAVEPWLQSILELDDGRVFGTVSPRWEHFVSNPIDVVALRCVP